MKTIMNEISSIVNLIRPTIMEIFDHLHQNPEVSWKEVDTTKYIVNFLREICFNQIAFIHL